jgi:hypothetical protein
MISPGVLMLLTVALVTGCYASDYTSPPRATTVSLALKANPIEIGQVTRAFGTAFDQYGTAIPVAGTFSSSAPEVAGVNPTSGVIMAISPGTAQITLTIDGSSDRRTITVFKSPIRINEVRPSGDAQKGFVELVNPTTADVDLSGWTLSASDFLQAVGLPTGTTIPAGGYLVVEESSFPRALDAADVVHLFSRFGVQVDQHAWSAYPATSFARCPDATGAFLTTAAPSRGTANACPPGAPAS